MNTPIKKTRKRSGLPNKAHTRNNPTGIKKGLYEKTLLKLELVEPVVHQAICDAVNSPDGQTIPDNLFMGLVKLRATYGFHALANFNKWFSHKQVHDSKREFNLKDAFHKGYMTKAELDHEMIHMSKWEYKLNFCMIIDARKRVKAGVTK